MSNLLSQASLVMIPSGYKEDVVYSPVPTDGSGDLSFTRASNGTRVNSAGLVEVCPWNLVTYSEQFTQYPPWLIQNITRADNVTTAPNGTTTAGKIYPSTTSSNPVMYSTAISVVSGQNYAVSIYAKAAGKNWIFIRTVDDAAAGVWFNLSTGAIGTQTSATGIIESVGDGWYRCTVIGAPTTTTGRCVYLVVDSNGSTTGTASGTDGIFIWGAQLNIGSTAKPYFPTTDRLNVPRLTYQNGGGGCPSLLLEKQSTNLITYSEQFDNAVHYKLDVTITANNITSPDGTQNADKLTETTGTGEHIVYDIDSNATGTYTLSAFFKGGAGTIYPVLRLNGSSTTAYAGCIFNTSTGAVVNTFYNTYSAPTTKVENMGNGWYRVSMTTTTTNANFGMRIAASNSTSPSVGAYGAISYTGSTSNYFYAWGAQLEASSYATSYIPTTSSSATRVADACYKTGISSLIGQSEGVLYMDFVPQVTSTAQSHLWIGAAGNEIGLYGNTQFIFYSSGGVSINGGAFVTGTRYKIAFAYKANDYVAYVNGVQVGTDTSATVPTTSAVYVNSYSDFTEVQNKQVNQAILFPTRLTNAELASLTTI